MKYDFDTIVPRRGTNSYKWDTPEEENVLPMWVADMDFRTAPAIIDALQKRVEHGIFGYTKVPETYYDAVVRWFEDRHRWRIDPRWIIYTSGVVPALSAIIKALTVPGDKVIVQTPAYNCFYSSIRNDGCELSANNLVYRNGRYSIDFDDFEAKAADEEVRRRIDRAININEVCDVNPFGVIATTAAYNEGGEWLDALRKYLWGNYEYLCRFFEERLPQYPVLPLEGTYLVWIDCRALGIGSDATTLRLQEGQKLMVNSGTMYGPGGEGFIRLNIACPRTLLTDGLERTARVLECC